MMTAELLERARTDLPNDRVQADGEYMKKKTCSAQFLPMNEDS